MFFIDLGVPRNFDPAINELEGVYLYNIDDLARVAEEHREERAREAVRAEEIVQEEADRFWHRVAAGDVTPTIVALRRKLEGIRRAELERALAVLPSLGERDRRALEAMTQAIVNKVLHPPTATLKKLAMEEEGDEAMAVGEVLRRVFDLEAVDVGSAEDDDDRE
jgi:glutamyl-tRNA reductase